MNNSDIQTILKKYRVSTNFFKGVYSSDNIPRFYNYPYALIANTDKRTGPGRHWVSFFVLNPKSVEYFDPLGNKPNADFEKYLGQFDNIRINYMKIQPLLNNNCGVYCIIFVLCRALGLTFNMTRDLLKKLEHHNIKIR